MERLADCGAAALAADLGLAELVAVATSTRRHDAAH